MSPPAPSALQILTCLLLAGCHSDYVPLVAMPANKMAAVIAECKKHDLEPVPYTSALTLKVVDIQCQPKQEKK